MKKILIICLLVYSTNCFSYNSFSDLDENEFIHEKNNYIELAFGGLARLFQKLFTKGGDDFIRNFIEPPNIKPLKPFKPSKLSPIKKSSFNWGHNPNPTVIRKGLEELLENDPDGYHELSTWDCPEHIQEAQFLSDLPKKDKCVAYHMRCNVVVETDKAMGSGFFYNTNTIITNYHVIADNSSNIKIEPFISDKKIDGNIIAIDQINDFAAIEIVYPKKQEGFGLIDTILNVYQPCFLSNVSPDIDANVIAIGNPQGRKFYVSKGHLKNYRDKYFNIIEKENKTLHWIEMNAYIAPGSSGGPLYHQGYVIGVNTGGKKNTQENYALHFIKLKNFIQYNEIDTDYFQSSIFDKDNTVQKLKLIIK